MLIFDIGGGEMQLVPSAGLLTLPPPLHPTPLLQGPFTAVWDS